MIGACDAEKDATVAAGEHVAANYRSAAGIVGWPDMAAEGGHAIETAPAGAPTLPPQDASRWFRRCVRMAMSGRYANLIAAAEMGAKARRCMSGVWRGWADVG